MSMVQRPVTETIMDPLNDNESRFVHVLLFLGQQSVGLEPSHRQRVGFS